MSIEEKHSLYGKGLKEGKTDGGRQKRGQKRELLHFQVRECRFDKHLGFLYSKKNLWKALFQAWTERGIRQRHTEWKTQAFLYTSCAFTCQSVAIKLLPHGQYAKILNSKGLKGCLWKKKTHTRESSSVNGQITVNISVMYNIYSIYNLRYTTRRFSLKNKK